MTAFSPRQMFALDEACRPLAEAFDATPYLVGTAVTRQEYRDVDVRLMLDGEAWRKLHDAGEHVIEYLGLIIGNHLANLTGLLIDFQIQDAEVANELHNGPRNPLGIRTLSNYRGDAWPSAHSTDPVTASCRYSRGRACTCVEGGLDHTPTELSPDHTDGSPS